MSVSAAELTAKKCTACEGDTPAFTPEQIAAHLPAVPEWKLSDDGKLIRRKYKFKNFVSAMAFLQKVGVLAEEEEHHPDLHLWLQERRDRTQHARDRRAVRERLHRRREDRLAVNQEWPADDADFGADEIR